MSLLEEARALLPFWVVWGPVLVYLPLAALAAWLAAALWDEPG